MSNPHPGSYAVPCIFDPKRTLASPLTVSVPGSKSITNRAMLLALLADGVTTLEGCLFSDDSRHFLACVRDLGFPVRADEKTGVPVCGKRRNRRPFSHCAGRNFPRGLSPGRLFADEEAAHGAPSRLSARAGS